MKRFFRTVSESVTGGPQQQVSSLQQQQGSNPRYSDREMTWDEIFAGAPTAPGSEAAQARHRQLREERGDDMTEQEEQELNGLFYQIYPQFQPKNRTP